VHCHSAKLNKTWRHVQKWKYNSTHSNHSSRWWWMGSCIWPGPFNPPSKEIRPLYPLNRRLGGVQSQSEQGGYMENLCPCYASHHDHPACSQVTILTTQAPVKQSASNILKAQSLFAFPSCTRCEPEYYVHSWGTHLQFDYKNATYFWKYEVKANWTEHWTCIKPYRELN
jgi:hypothetical protein